MSRTREFPDGTSVTFRTEQDAINFDNYLESTFTLTVDGEVIDSYKVKDRFNAKEFFGELLGK